MQRQQNEDSLLNSQTISFLFFKAKPLQTEPDEKIYGQTLL